MSFNDTLKVLRVKEKKRVSNQVKVKCCHIQGLCNLNCEGCVWK
jgi:hypothetical protein